MKRYAKDAQEIVARLMEDDVLEDDDLVKSVSTPSEDGYWTQIDGDYGDPWLYGGAWYNPAKQIVVYFDGVEYKKEVDPDEVPVPDQVLNKLPPEDPDWRENRQRDKIIGDYRYARAAFLNARTRRTFYEIDVEDEIPHHLQRYVEPVSAQFEPGVWEELPLPNKLLEIGRYVGMDNVGSSFDITKREAEKMLGFSL